MYMYCVYMCDVYVHIHIYEYVCMSIYTYMYRYAYLWEREHISQYPVAVCYEQVTYL